MSQVEETAPCPCGSGRDHEDCCPAADEARPGEIDWAEATRGVPTRDLLDDLDLADPGRRTEALDNFVWSVESGCVLTWEAIIREEQGLELLGAHEERLGQLFTLGDEDDLERILYVDEMERMDRPWYEAAVRLATSLRKDVLDTAGELWDVDLEGWPRLVAALEDHAAGLSLPADAASTLEVVPTELRAHLAVQAALAALCGLGQLPELSLSEPDQGWRVDEVVSSLRETPDSVRVLGLTLEGLLARVRLPEGDARILAARLRQELGVQDDKAPALLRESEGVGSA